MAKIDFIHADDAAHEAEQRQTPQRPGHRTRRFMGLAARIRFRRAQERHEEEPEHVESGEQRDEQRSEEHTSELQSLAYLVCRLLLEKKKGVLHLTYHAGLRRDARQPE